MILNEETFDILNFDVPDVTNADIEVADIDATVPEAGPEVGVETLLMQAIKDIYGMIEGYNSLSIALTDIGNESAAVAIADIIRMEHSNIGALQDILKEISPNAEAVDINESLNESSEEKYIYTFDVPEIIAYNFDVDGVISYVLERLLYHSDDKIDYSWYDNKDNSYSIETYNKDDNKILEDNFEKVFFNKIKDDNDYDAQTHPDFYDEDETIQMRDICNKKLKAQ